MTSLFFTKKIHACLLFCIISSSVFSQSSPQNHIPTPLPSKINLLFSDAFVDKANNLPMPVRYYTTLKQIETALHIEFNIQLYPWNRAVNIATTQGELIFGLSKTPERLAIFTFSEPISQNYIWLVTRADKVFSYTKIEDLKGKTVDIFRGAKYGGDFDKNEGILFKIEEGSGTYSQRLSRLHLRRIDTMIFSSEFNQASEVEKQINDIVKNELQQENKNEQYHFKVLPIPVSKDLTHLAIIKGKNEQLIEKINQFLRTNQVQKKSTPM